MRTMTAVLHTALLLCLSALPLQAATDPLHDEIIRLSHGWAQVNYQTSNNRKEEEFSALEERALALAEQNPTSAEPLVWHAIILSSHAGVHGGLGALSMVRKARALLEQAQSIEPDVMEGSIYTSLGSLYYQVPGWPLGFGDDDKAEALLLKALELNPDGIDPNYFYGDFLYRNGKTEAALEALNKALQAPPRPSRPLADEGRRDEIRALIARIQSNG